MMFWAYLIVSSMLVIRDLNPKEKGIEGERESNPRREDKEIHAIF